jgi:anti-anti-sigma regulatory factor
MTITTSQAQGSVPVTILGLQGDLDASNYLDVIAEAREAYGAGARHMVLDMSQVPFMSSSGLMALHSIALLMRGEEPPDPEYGWSAFHAMGHDAEEGGTQETVKLAGLQPRVERALQMARFDQYFGCYADVGAAVASF